MKILIIPCLLFSCLSLSLYSQKTWTLEECIRYALENNIQVKQQEINTKMGENNLLQSKLDLIPSVNASSNYSYSVGRALDPTTYEFEQNQKIQNINGSVSSSVTLFSGLQKFNTIKLERNSFMASVYDLETLKNDIRLAVVSGYLQVLFSKELLQASGEQLAVTLEQVERTRQLVEAGSLASAKLLEIEAQAAQEELNVVNAENNLDLAYLDLRQLLELEKTGDFEIVFPELDDPAFALATDSVDMIYNQSVEIMPQIKSADYRLAVAYNSLGIARGGRSPRLNANASYGSGYSDIRQKPVSQTLIEQEIGYTRGGDIVYSRVPVTMYDEYSFFEQLDDNASTTFSLSLTIPIFNGWMTNNAISNARLAVDRSRMGLENEKKMLYKEIQQAYADAKAASKKFMSANKALEASRESFKYIDQKYDVGLVNTVEYNTAKTRLAITESDLLQAKYDFIFRYKILDFYMGETLTLNNIK
ncbi:MAG: TolC family protein [Bacteroidota bacterium]